MNGLGDDDRRHLDGIESLLKCSVMYNVQRFTGGFTATNGYVFTAPDGPVAVDAPSGMYEWLKAEGISPVALLLTHAHFDHVMDAGKIAAGWGIPVYAWGKSTAADRLELLLSQYLGQTAALEDYPVDKPLAGVPSMEAAGAEFAVLHVPGHSPDSLVFVHAGSGSIFCGDTVMDGGIGRPDLPGGDHDLLVEGIRGKLLTLPPEWRFLPGHGEVSTVGWEIRNNMYLS